MILVAGMYLLDARVMQIFFSFLYFDFPKESFAGVLSRMGLCKRECICGKNAYQCAGTTVGIYALRLFVGNSGTTVGIYARQRFKPRPASEP